MNILNLISNNLYYYTCIPLYTCIILNYRIKVIMTCIIICIWEDYDFLLFQRKKGQKGDMIGVDTKLSQIKKYKANTLRKVSKCLKREIENIGRYLIL